MSCNPIVHALIYDQYICRTLVVPSDYVFTIPELVQYVACGEAYVEGEILIIGELLVT